MIYIADTHAIIWHLERDPKLSSKADGVLSANDSKIIVPAIVLAELWDLFQRKRAPISLEDLRASILGGANYSVHPLDEEVLEFLPSGLEIHDSIIVATALVFREVRRTPTRLITCDRRITESGLIEVLW